MSEKEKRDVISSAINRIGGLMGCWSRSFVTGGYENGVLRREGRPRLFRFWSRVFFGVVTCGGV